MRCRGLPILTARPRVHPLRETWLLVGSSKDAPIGLRWARRMLAEVPHCIITTNSGLKLVHRPDYYLLHDPVAARVHRFRWARAQMRGARIIRCVIVGPPAHRDLMRRLIPSADIEQPTVSDK